MNSEKEGLADQKETAGRVRLLDRPLRVSLGWLLVTFIVVLQYGCFRQYAQREVTWAYPRNSDQAVYLSRSYQTFEQILNHGLAAGLHQGLLMAAPNGKMIHLQAALLYLLLGPSRLSALTLNFLYLALLEYVMVYCALWFSGRWSIALFGLGLLLSTKTITTLSAPGSVMDFRIDFIAFCLFGVFLLMVVRSRLFASLKWSLVAGIVAACLVLFRFLTTTYVAVILTTALILFGIEYLRSAPQRRAIWVKRIRGVISCGVVMLLLAGPTIWLSRQDTLHYYGSLVNTEEGRVRYAEFGGLLWSDFLLSYPKSLVEDHLGCTWFGLVGVGLAFALFTAIKNRGKTRSDVGSPSGEVRGAILFAALCLILPLAVLTIFPSRSPVTASVLVGPAIVLALLTIVAFTRRGPAVSTTWQWVALSGLALCIGLYTELSSFSSKGPLAGATNDVKGLAAIYDDIGLQSAQLGWDKPRIAFDRVREYMNSAVLEAWFYERHGVLLDPAPILGHSIMPVNESEALSAISGCDFVVITKPTVDTPGFEYPYNRQMKELYPKLLAATEHSMVPLKNVDAFSQHMTLFVRPTLRLSGQTSDGWITSEGLILSGPSQWVRLRPKIEFAGRIPRLLEQSGNGLGAHAILDVAEKSKEVAATLTQATGEYKLSIQLDPADLPTDGDVQVRVMFDNYFVPSERGLGSDTRRLVIMAPQQIHLFPKD